MSAKNSNTTSDYIEWDSAINLIHKLYRDGDYRMSLLVGCGVFFCKLNPNFTANYIT